MSEEIEIIRVVLTPEGIAVDTGRGLVSAIVTSKDPQEFIRSVVDSVEDAMQVAAGFRSPGSKCLTKITDLITGKTEFHRDDAN